MGEVLVDVGRWREEKTECDVWCMMFFFFKQKTAYEMLRSLVGSEMCIRDRVKAEEHTRKRSSERWNNKAITARCSEYRHERVGYG